MKLIGVVLIVVGVLALAFGGVNYTTRERVVDLGPLKVDADKQHSVPIAPIALPGEIFPPLLTATPPTVPLPISMAPELTVTTEVSAPSASSMPPFTNVPPR